MKKKDLNTTRNKKLEELRKLAEKKKTELIRVKANLEAGREKDLKKVKNQRHELSQLLTIIREKEIIGRQKKGKTDKKSVGRQKAKNSPRKKLSVSKLP